MSSKVLNLKTKLEGDELDLSMSRLTEIPVSDIACIRKATKLDLSNNEILRIPEDFATSLIPIVKIDLSSNKLRDLPNNFGALINLKHLDLYNNQLTDLPLSLSSLHNLRYLDLKNNPLRVDLAKASGDCLDNKQCQLSAKRVIAHLRYLKTEKDREFALASLKEKERNMAKQKQEEEERARENEKKKMEKKAQKEKRRMEMEEAKRRQEQQQQLQQKLSHKNEVQNGKTNKKEQEKRTSQSKDQRNYSNKKSGKWSWLGLVNWFLLSAVLISVIVGVGVYSGGDFSEKGLRAAWGKALNNSQYIVEATKETATFENLKWSVENAWKVLGPYLLKVQETLLMGLSATKNLAFTAFQALQSVTGDLSPYVDGLIPYWDAFVKNLAWVWSKLDLGLALEGAQWFVGFLVDQFRVINQEFWSNEIVVSIWKDSQPFREFVWGNTVTLRYYFWYLIEELSVTWFPLLKRTSLEVYDLSRERISSLFGSSVP